MVFAAGVKKKRSLLTGRRLSAERAAQRGMDFGERINNMSVFDARTRIVTIKKN